MKTLILAVSLAGGALFAAPPNYGLVTVPASGSAWVDAEPRAQADDLQSLKKDMAELKALMKEIRDLIKDDGQGEAKGKTDERGANAFTAAVSTCVQCHGSDVAAKKGEKFVMFQVGKGDDGKPQAALRDDFERRDLRKMISEVEDGTMPKKSSGKKLDAEQKAAFLAEMKARLEQVEK